MNTQQIVMPADGLSEKFVRAAFDVSAAQLHVLMGNQLGAPRDYSMPTWAPGAVFTATGVRNLAALLEIPVDVIEEGVTPAAQAPAPETHSPHHPRPERRAQDGYQVDGDPVS